MVDVQCGNAMHVWYSMTVIRCYSVQLQLHMLSANYRGPYSTSVVTWSQGCACVCGVCWVSCLTAGGCLYW